MARGRKPTADIIKFARGTARKDRTNPAAPRLAVEIPEPPEVLNADALEEWARVSQNLLTAGVITALDRAILAAYCQSYADWIGALRVLNRLAAADEQSGARLIRTQGGNTIQNPLIGIANKARSDMARYAAELGITPASRSRVQVVKSTGDDPSDKYDI